MLPVVGLEGRVVGEVQVKFTEAGKAVARFRVKAADRRKDNESGRWEDAEVLWLTVTAFGPLAEHCAESLVDGDQVVVVGKWSTAEWVDQAGVQRSSPRFVAQAVGAGLQFAPRRHQSRPPTAVVEEPDGAHSAYGERVAPAGQGVRADDPWA